MKIIAVFDCTVTDRMRLIAVQNNLILDKFRLFFGLFSLVLLAVQVEVVVVGGWMLSNISHV